MGNGDDIVLDNDVLTVVLDAGFPVARSYVHKPSGCEFSGPVSGGGMTGRIKINGSELSREHLEIVSSPEEAGRRYSIAAFDALLRFDIVFRLNEASLSLDIERIEDEGCPLSSIEWIGLLFLIAKGSDIRFYRLGVTEPDVEAIGKMWLRDAEGEGPELVPEKSPVPLIYGSICVTDRVCVFLHSNYPLFPQSHRVNENGDYELHLGEYHYRVRSQTLAPLRAELVFLGDLNEDGKIDVSDYRLWVNRRLPDCDSLYRDSIWYKIQCDLSGPHPEAGVVSTLAESEEIIRAFHNVTDGLPQAAFLVNAHSSAPDAKYPTLGTFNENLGTLDELRELAERCKSNYNALLSYHANIDDAHRSSRDFDEDLVGKRYATDETVFEGEDRKASDNRIFGGISHTKDVESGSIFDRFESMFRLLPVERTIHLDNMRLSNCEIDANGESNSAADPNRIGMLEELVCGLLPIMEWLADRGISVSGEGYNGVPIDQSMLLSGFWHHDVSDSARQIFHGKLAGGGRGNHYGGATTMDYGICKSFHQDITYHPVSESSLGSELFHKVFFWLDDRDSLTLSFLENWPDIVERIYLGSMLNLFYLEREMRSWNRAGEGYRVCYEDDTVAEICIDSPSSLLVTWKEVIVAEGTDRFVPLGDAVYCYSVDGCTRNWTLPEYLIGMELSVYSLSIDGRGSTADYRILDNGSIELVLSPRTPVKISAWGR